jgi:hypothetical protein
MGLWTPQNGLSTGNRVSSQIIMPPGLRTGAPPLFYIGKKYCEEAKALFARMTIQPTDALKDLINKTIVDLKTAGIWGLTDTFHKWDLHNEQASLLDWKNPAFNATAINTPTFIPKVGVTTYSTGSRYIKLNFIPSSDCVNASLNNLGIYIDDMGNGVTPIVQYQCGGYSKDGLSRLHFRYKYTTVNTWLLAGIVNNSSNFTKTLDYLAYIPANYSIERSASNVTKIYMEKVAQATSIVASISMIDNSIAVGGFTNANGTYSATNGMFSYFWLGSSLTTQQRSDWIDIITYWKNNIGGTF